MPEQWAGDVGWLGAGWLFAAVPGALARLAWLAAPARRRARRSCGQAVAGSRQRALAWLPCAAFAPIVACAANASHAVAATVLGALCGAWFVRRYGRSVRPRLVATAGGVLGAAAVAGGFSLHLLAPRHDVLDRGALYAAVSLGAWMLAVSASAGFAGGARGDGRRSARFAAARPALDDRIACGLAVTLCVALACGFAAAGTSGRFRLAALVAACVLTSSLGARMTTGARFAASNGRLPAGLRAVAARADSAARARIGLMGIPEERLVAACGGETFDAACLPDGNGRDGSCDAARLAARPRRRRGRHGRAAPHGSARTH